MPTKVKKINVADKMKALVKKLENEGFNGIEIPLGPECAEEWNHQYAIVDGFYTDHMYEDGPYMQFDRDTFEMDFREMLKEHFGVDQIRGDGYREKDKPKVGDLVVRVYVSSQEIEVYYQTHPHGECLVWWVDQAACEASEVKKDKLPAYLLEQFESRQGRSGRQRLWIANEFSANVIEEIMEDADFTDVPEGAGGLIFHMSDLKIMKKFPGVITDLNLDVL